MWCAPTFKFVPAPLKMGLFVVVVVMLAQKTSDYTYLITVNCPLVSMLLPQLPHTVLCPALLYRFRKYPYATPLSYIVCSHFLPRFSGSFGPASVSRNTTAFISFSQFFDAVKFPTHERERQSKRM